ncbi:hypothetical protein [Paraburkholderia sp.]|uniref:hypothetical protein n=1 Tax=Paraburkholderia sp. TaxID=1926495 RepID=UPI00238B060C|nr:hypothetical protein [Paraburkholderia sp.]MDE1184469.1 hypothetical protein [Paraburkholderia sp.]
MFSVLSVRAVRAHAVAASFVTIAAVIAPASSAVAASTSTRAPLVLDTQHGISDGQSGTVLQTAPLSRAPIVQAQPIATPTQLTPNSSVPVIVAPYIQLSPDGSQSSQSQTQTRPVRRVAPQ